MSSALRAIALAIGIAATAQPIGARDRLQSSAASAVILVELFTAEGCSSCPPADKLLEALIATQPAAGAQIVGIGEHVDYWNALGWVDRFSSASMTARQRLYADRARGGEIYTPQMVVDGTDAFVGSDVAAARRAIERAAAAAHGRVSVAVSAVGEREIEVSVTASGLPAIDPGDRAEITVAIVEDGLRSDVRRGENAGRQLTHAAVARLLTDAGRVEGPIGQARLHAKLGADWARDRLTVIAFVQARASRRVLATAATPLPR